VRGSSASPAAVSVTMRRSVAAVKAVNLKYLDALLLAVAVRKGGNRRR
jgi:hypothetical protein